MLCCWLFDVLKCIACLCRGDLLRVSIHCPSEILSLKSTLIVTEFSWDLFHYQHGCAQVWLEYHHFKALPFRTVANGAWLTVELRPSLLSVLYSTEILNVNGNILWCFFDKEGKYGITLLSLWLSVLFSCFFSNWVVINIVHF